MKDAVTSALIEKAHTYAAVQVDVNVVTIKQHALTLMSVPAIKENSLTFSLLLTCIIVATSLAIC